MHRRVLQAFLQWQTEGAFKNAHFVRQTWEGIPGVPA